MTDSIHHGAKLIIFPESAKKIEEICINNRKKYIKCKVNGICNAIVKAERDTKFKATNTPEQLAELRQLIDHSIENWISVYTNHRAEQSRLITEHESNMLKILRRNEGVWFSDFRMKVLVILLLVYTLGLWLVVYYAT